MATDLAGGYIYASVPAQVFTLNNSPKGSTKMRIFSMFALVAAAIAGLTFSVSADSTAQAEARLHEVHSIYVGNMGADDEANRFRLLLEEQVAKKGFVIVDSPDKADAVLSGALSVRVHRNNSTARAYVTWHTLK